MTRNAVTHERLNDLLRMVEEVIVERSVQYARQERMAVGGQNFAAHTAVEELIGPIRRVFAEYAQSEKVAPVAWIVTKGDQVFHFSVADGWRVDAVAHALDPGLELHPDSALGHVLAHTLERYSPVDRDAIIEECAKVCDEASLECRCSPMPHAPYMQGCQAEAESLAVRIRAIKTPAPQALQPADHRRGVDEDNLTVATTPAVAGPSNAGPQADSLHSGDHDSGNHVQPAEPAPSIDECTAFKEHAIADLKAQLSAKVAPVDRDAIIDHGRGDIYEAWVYAYTSLGCDRASAEKMVNAEIDSARKLGVTPAAAGPSNAGPQAPEMKFETHCPDGQMCGATTTGCLEGQCKRKHAESCQCSDTVAWCPVHGYLPRPVAPDRLHGPEDSYNGGHEPLYDEETIKAREAAASAGETIPNSAMQRAATQVLKDTYPALAGENGQSSVVEPAVTYKEWKHLAELWRERAEERERELASVESDLEKAISNHAEDLSAPSTSAMAARLRAHSCGELSCDQCNEEREGAAALLDGLAASAHSAIQPINGPAATREQQPGSQANASGIGLSCSSDANAGSIPAGSAAPAGETPRTDAAYDEVRQGLLFKNFGSMVALEKLRDKMRQLERDLAGANSLGMVRIAELKDELEAARSASVATEECLGKPARYWYDAFQIAEGLRADAERRVSDIRRELSDAVKTVEFFQKREEQAARETLKCCSPGCDQPASWCNKHGIDR